MHVFVKLINEWFLNMISLLLNLIPWQNGRQQSGYKKFKLFESKKLMADCYLLLYPQGSEVREHKDTSPVENKKHYRFNVVLKQADWGGGFACRKVIFSTGTWLYFFRPDLYDHWVTKVQEGSRLVLSFGLLL